MSDFFQEKLEALIEQKIRDEELPPGTDLEELVSDVYREFLPKFAEEMKPKIEEAATKAVREYRRNNLGFIKRNYARWASGFDALEVLISVAIDVGSTFNKDYRPKAVDESDFVFEMLAHLHARACLIAHEITALLRCGFPDAAHARWRSLHETTVTALFIQKHGEAAAIRYMEHEAVARYKSVNNYSTHTERLKHKPVDKEWLDALKAQFDFVLEKYGSDFEEAYGWAMPHLNINKKAPNFADLERDVELDHLRPYYKMASEHVHAASLGIHPTLALSEAEEPGLLVGPSNSGFSDPAQCTALSLTQCTTAFLTHECDTERLVSILVIDALRQDVIDKFLAIETAPKPTTA